MEPKNGYLLCEKENYGFRFKYPEDWTSVETPIDNLAISLVAPEKNATEPVKRNYKSSIDSIFKTNFNVFCQDLSSCPMSLDAYIERTLDQMKSLHEEFEVVSTEYTQISGATVKKVVCRGNFQGKHRIQFLQYYAIKDFRAYVLTYSADRDYYLNYLDEVNDLISSFEIFYEGVKCQAERPKK